MYHRLYVGGERLFVVTTKFTHSGGKKVDIANKKLLFENILFFKHQVMWKLDFPEI